MNSSDNDNLLFDRLVDDELSADERKRLLASLDSQQDGWRRCALAFLEQQAWRRQMKAIVADPSATEKVTPARRESSQHNSRRGLGVLALAACLLVAFLAGRSLRTDSQAGDNGSQLAATDVKTGLEKNIDAQPVPEISAVKDHDVVTLLVRDDQGQAKRVRVPLVELASDSQLSEAMVNSFPVDYRESLKRQGKQLRGRRRYAPLYFEQDQQVVPMAVPVDDAYIVPVGGPVL